jgi:hypothetical protein
MKNRQRGFSLIELLICCSYYFGPIGYRNSKPTPLTHGCERIVRRRYDPHYQHSGSYILYYIPGSRIRSDYSGSWRSCTLHYRNRHNRLFVG